jgi:peroxiredoxin
MLRSSGLVLMVSVAALNAQSLSLGGKLERMTVTDLAGGKVEFALKGQVTAVIFISTVCPISNDYNDRMTALYRDYSAKGVRVVFVNANSNESSREVIDHAKAAGFSFQVYKDEGNPLADQLGASVTPDTFVIDKDGVLRYHGYIDDARNTARVHNNGLRDALEAVLAGKPVSHAETKAFGCTIKKVRKAS